MSLASPHRTTGEMITASIWNTDLVDALNSINVSSDGQNWTGAVVSVGTKTGLINGSLNGNSFTSILNKAASGVHPGFNGLLITAPVIGGGAATLANAATLTVADAPTGGVTNYALLVTGNGTSQMQGNLSMYTDVNHGILFDDSRVTGVSGTTVKGYVGPSSGQLLLATNTTASVAFAVNSAIVLTLGDAVTIPLAKFEMGTADLETIALASTGDVAHGFTTDANASVFGTLRKASATAGGLSLAGYTETTIGLHLNGNGTTGDLTKATSSTASVVITASGLGLGTTATTWATNFNLLAVRNNTATQFIVNADGDTFYNGAAPANYDKWDDIALARTLDLTFRGPDLIETQWDEFIQYKRSDLERAGIVSPDGFINQTKHTRLLNGAIGQIGLMLRDITERLDILEQARVDNPRRRSDS